MLAPPVSSASFLSGLSRHLTDRDSNKVWTQALANRQITWTKGDPLTDTIRDALAETFVYAGSGIKIAEKISSPHRGVHEAMRYLIGNERDLPSGALSMRSVKAVLLRKDSEVLGAVFQELKSILSECAGKLPAVGFREEALFQAFVGNIIAILPYSCPRVGESLIIPQKIDGVWTNCTYTIDRRIDMSPNWWLSPLAAYGLLSEEAPPLLVFSGTTPPAWDGFTASLAADFTPGMSVGHIAYLWGRSEIEEWIGKKKVRLYGLSLGGALCMHVLRNHRTLVSEVNAYNPALLYSWDWPKKPFDEVPVNVYCQENDFVAKGLFPKGEGVSIYQVSGSEVHNSFKAHVLVFTGMDHVLITKSSPEYENNRPYRKFLTVAHMIASVFLGIVPFVCLGTLYLIYSSCKRISRKEIEGSDVLRICRKITGFLKETRPRQ